MDDEFLGHELEEWYPMEPQYGPPLPRWWGIFWPWYKGVAPPPVVYTCPYCGATFATEAEMNYHIQTQHAAPPVYTCPYCGATFATEAERDYHVQTQHPTPPPTVYTCPYCGATFSTQADLDAHIQTEHPAPPPPPPGTASLYGRVTDSVTGVPVAGAEVRVLAGTIIRGATTQADGTYLISDLSPGATIWACLKDGYVVITDQPITLLEGNNQLNIGLVPIGPVSIGSLQVRMAGGYTETKITVINSLGRTIPAYDPTWGAATRLSALGISPSIIEQTPFGPYYPPIYAANFYAVEIPMGTKVFEGVSDSPTTAPEGTFVKAFVAIDGVSRYAGRGFEGYLRSAWQTWQPDGLIDFPPPPPGPGGSPPPTGPIGP